MGSTVALPILRVRFRRPRWPRGGRIALVSAVVCSLATVRWALAGEPVNTCFAASIATAWWLLWAFSRRGGGPGAT